MKTRFAVSLIALGLSASLIPSVAAQAAYDPLASGSMTLVLAKPLAAVLVGYQVKVETRAGATRKGGRIALPAAGGEVDPRLGLAAVEGEGSVIFAAGRRKVVFRHLAFKAKRAPLYAKVGGGQLKLAAGARVSSRRSGFGASFKASGLKLTAKLATRLNKKLGLGKSLKAGQLLGTVAAEASPATVHLEPRGRLTLAVDPAFYTKLSNLFVSLNPIAPAELAAGPTLSFPVGLESTLAPGATSGTVKLGGAVELLQLGSTQLFWRELWLEPEGNSLLAETDTEPSPPNPGKQPQGPLLALSGGALASDPSARTIAISGQSVTLDPATAAALNAAFAKGQPTFAAGEAVGTMSISTTAE